MVFFDIASHYSTYAQRSTVSTGKNSSDGKKDGLATVILT